MTCWLRERGCGARRVRAPLCVCVRGGVAAGDLPIHWAATRGHVAVLQLLIKHGSPVDPINKLTWTPLHRAAYNGRK